MHSVGKNPSLIRILAGAIFASLGNPDIAARKTYNPSRTTQHSPSVSIYGGHRNNPPRRGKAVGGSARSKELTTKLISDAAFKRGRKDLKRRNDYLKCTRGYHPLLPIQITDFPQTA